MSTIDKIVNLLEIQNKKQKELTDYLGITKNAFTDWKADRIKSYQKHLPKIAEFFGVSVDYLLDREDAPPQAPSDYAKLNELGKQKADEYISLLLSNPEYTEQSFVEDIAKEIKLSLSTPLSTPKLKS